MILGVRVVLVVGAVVSAGLGLAILDSPEVRIVFAGLGRMFIAMIFGIVSFVALSLGTRSTKRKKVQRYEHEH
jgi:hypothetical protein